MSFATLPTAESGWDWTIARGDALSCLRVLVDDSVDAFVTDPPYSSGGQFRGDRTAATKTKYQTSDSAAEYPDFYGDTRDVRGWILWCSLWLAEAWRAAKPGGVVASFVDWRMLPALTDAIQAGGWTWRGIAVWRKKIARPQLGRFTQEAEFVVWGSKGDMPADRGVGVLPGAWEADDVPRGAHDLDLGGGWWNASPVPQSDREHLTEKPVELMRRIVRLCAPGGLVVDPFAGAGTTAIAAALEGRRFEGLELGVEYHRIAVRRRREHDAAAERGAFDRGQMPLLGAP